MAFRDILLITRCLSKKQTSRYIFLAVYVDDILLTRSEINETKEHMKRYFVTKDMGKLMYFLGIEFA